MAYIHFTGTFDGPVSCCCCLDVVPAWPGAWNATLLYYMQYYCNVKKKTAEKPMEIHMEGYEVIEKIVTQHATSAKILVPRHWIGKRARAVRLDPEPEDKDNQ